MGLLTGSGISIRDARISSTSQLSLLPPGMHFQCNVSISIKPSPQFHSHLQLQLSTNQKLMVVSALGDGGIDGETQRNSPLEVEIQRCYQFVHRLGRGVWDLRSSQVKPTHPHYLLALELSREVGKMLDCTTWTGAGPGLMNAVIRSALQAKKPVGEWTSSNFHPCLLTLILHAGSLLQESVG